jgi:hypothetical protein
MIGYLIISLSPKFSNVSVTQSLFYHISLVMLG